MLGFVLVVCGGVLAVPQLFTVNSRPSLFVAGLLLVFAGVCLVGDGLEDRWTRRRR